MSEYIWPKPSSFPDWSDLHNLSVGVSRDKIYNRQEWTDHHGRIHVMIDAESDKVMTDEEYQKYKTDRYEAMGGTSPDPKIKE